MIEAVADRELRELERRERAYRDDRPAPDVRGRTVILVDDGLATGSTMRSRRRGPPPARAGPHRRGRPDRGAVDVRGVPPRGGRSASAPSRPSRSTPSALWYEDFSQTTDDEVRDLLARAAVTPARVTVTETMPAEESRRAMANSRR